MFCLILGQLLSNLSRYGTTPIGEDIVPSGTELEGTTLLKRSAKLVTAAISTNGTQGIHMSSALGCWRSLRHLAATVAAVSTRLG